MKTIFSMLLLACFCLSGSASAAGTTDKEAMAMTDKAVAAGKVSATQVAQMVFDAISADHFYIYSHPKALANAQQRFDAIVAGANPGDPFAERPEIGAGLRQSLRGG